MFGRNSLLQIPFLIVVLVLAGFGIRYAYTQGFRTIIASELASKPAETQPLSFQPLSGCGLDSHLRYENPLRCKMEMRAAAADQTQPLTFHADPLPTMTKEQSETAGGWLLLAGLGIPLSLGIAGFFGFLMFRHASRQEDEEANSPSYRDRIRSPR